MSEAITKALQMAIRQNERDMLMTADELRIARAALSQPAPAPQPAAPVVSDEQIKETIDCIDWSQMVTADDYMYMIARAILALRPAVEPMTPFTPSQRMRLWQNTEKGKSATSLGAFERICQAVEAAHRIGQESPQPAMPVVEAFAEGWKMAADWANRDDLLPDMDSPQYAKERDERLAELRPAVEPMTDEQREVLAALVVGACEHKTRTLLALRAIEATEGQYGIGITAKAEGGA